MSAPRPTSSSPGKPRGCLDYVFGAWKQQAAAEAAAAAPLILLPTSTGTGEHHKKLVSSQGRKGGDHVAVTLERLARLEQVSKMICGDELRQVPDRVRLGIEAELRLADYRRLLAGGGGNANSFLMAETQAHLFRMEAQLKSAYQDFSARLRAAEVKSRRKNGVAAASTPTGVCGALSPGVKSAAAASTTALCLGDAPPGSHGGTDSAASTPASVCQGPSAPAAASDIAAAASDVAAIEGFQGRETDILTLSAVRAAPASDLETVGSSLPPDPGEVGGASMQSSSRHGTASDSVEGAESVSLEVDLVAPELEVPHACIPESDPEMLPLPIPNAGGNMQPGSSKNVQENTTSDVDTCAGEETQGAGTESMKLVAQQEEDQDRDRDQERIEESDVVPSSCATLLSRKKLTVDLALIAASNAEDEESVSDRSTKSPSSILSPTDRDKRSARRKRGKRACNSSSPPSSQRCTSSLSPSSAAKPSPKSVSSSSTKSSPKSVSSSSSTTPVPRSAAPRRDNAKSMSPTSSFRSSPSSASGSKQHDKQQGSFAMHKGSPSSSPSSSPKSGSMSTSPSCGSKQQVPFGVHKTCAGAARIHACGDVVPWRY